MGLEDKGRKDLVSFAETLNPWVSWVSVADRETCAGRGERPRCSTCECPCAPGH